MKVFWEHGYEGTSFDELSRATGLSASSFYNTFGSKERLYEETVRFYVEGPGRFFRQALADGTSARDSFRRLLEATAVAFTSEELPRGCMFSLAGLHVAPSQETVRDAMREQRRRSERVLVQRLKEAVAAGELPADTDAPELAGYFDAMIRGMAVKARDGATRKTLAKIATRAMLAWPAAE